ncbi:Mov34/MPN/PAD-1 family protein [Caballeronia sp. LZ001]|uniref:Mov34/MPN/PAD-1 family protein n=1 Tax=Caballeronia sp. LZ001 TaxID=3038553 RepID=UPI002854612A|nr:Mov34/MPN/PAD-1 family protein [Caballeronia sp. LZ001]MDR5804972.1 Mov34/MPN/PAD-1 family protein [Caballeronia sp. LZ001]
MNPARHTPHEARALRVDFPATGHQNGVSLGQPASLCLYFEPWSAVELTWTPVKHLERVLWWLRETARETLHRSDEPLERLHFVSPYQIVLPADFRHHVAAPDECLGLVATSRRDNSKVLRGFFQPRTAAKTAGNDLGLDTLVVKVPPMVSVRIERDPDSLGELHDQLARYGSTFLEPLIGSTGTALPASGLPLYNTGCRNTLLVIQVPVAPDIHSAPTRVDVLGFIVRGSTLAQLGVACGAYIDGKDGNAYRDVLVNPGGNDGTATHVVESWRALRIEPVDVRIAFSVPDARRASGLSAEDSEFEGVLAGVGALGSCLAELWCRQGWGHWTYIDDDTLFAHNLVRHAGEDEHIGWAKVDAVRDVAMRVRPRECPPLALLAKVNDSMNAPVAQALGMAALLVDATTTLEVPRDLSTSESVPRSVSAFLTPSGRASVTLLEDAERSIRLDSLEAQYYRAILNSGWGDDHLTGHLGSYYVGAGCRDLSGVLSQDVVHLHGATLARQIRLLSSGSAAQIRIWTLDEQNGGLTADIVPVERSHACRQGNWSVVWDEGLEKKLHALRTGLLPRETGGIVLGTIDQKRRSVYLVDVLPEPPDSTGSETAFVRGAASTSESVERAAALTANIVGYVGEWHSHPAHASSVPSTTDNGLLSYLAESLAADWVPAVMVIAGERDISISLRQAEET